MAYAAGYEVIPTPTWLPKSDFKEKWIDQDYFLTPNGAGNFPDHHCKKTFYASLPHVTSFRNAVDIGCRDGEYTRYLARHFRHVYCFDPRFRQLFPHNADMNKVTHHTCALGAEQGEITMWGGVHHVVKGMPPEKYPCFCLDDFNLDFVDYIKIDTNGFEMQVLFGAEQTIFKWRPMIVLEQENKQFSAIEWLYDHGYHLVAKRKDDYILIG